MFFRFISIIALTVVLSGCGPSLQENPDTCIQQNVESLHYEKETLQKGTFTFNAWQNPNNITLNESEVYCPHGKCICEADVNYVWFKYVDPGIIDINHYLKKSAEDRLCVNDVSYSYLQQEVTWNTPNIVSLKITGFTKPTGFRPEFAKCYGKNEVHTYNVKTGREYFLKDIVDITKIKQIRATLSESILQKAAEDGAFPPNQMAHYQSNIKYLLYNISDDQLLNLGFYIEDGKVLINTDQYYFSCAGGNFRPGEIGWEFISDDMLDELDITNSECN